MQMYFILVFKKREKGRRQNRNERFFFLVGWGVGWKRERERGREGERERGREKE